jgi:hypothetical protein
MFVSDVEGNPLTSILEMSNGAKVLCKKMPPMLLSAFDRSHQEPKPPLAEVETLGGKKTVEENPDDPAYRVRLAEFENKRAMDFMELALDYVELLDESPEQKQERSTRLERYGIEENNRNRVESFALEDPEQDIQRVTAELMRLSTVTTAEVAKQKDMFQPPMDGDERAEAGYAEEPPDLRGRESVPLPGISAEEDG